MHHELAARDPQTGDGEVTSSEWVNDCVVDQACREMWETCVSYDDDGGVQITAHHDQWWGVFVECPHITRVRGVSRGTGDPSTAFMECRDEFVKNHPRKELTQVNAPSPTLGD